MNAEPDLPRFILYGTSACHLCEIAEGMLVSLEQRAGGFDFIKVDISDSDALFERYGVLIPVLQRPDGGELGWPFTLEQLAQFIGQ